MVISKQIVLSSLAAAVLFTGCAVKKVEKVHDSDEISKNIIQKELEKIEKKKRSKSSLPPLILPSVYTEPSITGTTGKKITFSATDAPLSKLLYMISDEAGLNLVVDNDLNVTKPITLNLKDSPLQDALDITMDISNAFIEVKGNILHVKSQMTKTFEIPFINMMAATTSNVGGDMLGAGDADTGLTGEYSIGYTSEEDNMDYYKQIEDSLENILTPEVGKYSMNKFSGTLVVTDTKKVIDQVETMIDNLQKFIGKQILIEAKIMEVVLNNENQLGVNWQNVWNTRGGQLGASSGFGSGVNPSFSTFTAGAASPIASGVATTVAFSKENFSAVLAAMQSAGSVEVVSNPRIKVINGQTGMISSGNMVPYWEKEVNYVKNTTGETTTVTPEITYSKMDVLNGISLGVSPIIKDNGEVILNVVPVVTNIEGEKTLMGAEGETARAPILNVKEAGTTIITKSNDMIVIGGLISSTKKETENKTPLLGDIPYLGALFRSTEKSMERRELVIILKIDVDTRKN